MRRRAWTVIGLEQCEMQHPCVLEDDEGVETRGKGEGAGVFFSKTRSPVFRSCILISDLRERSLGAEGRSDHHV